MDSNRPSKRACAGLTSPSLSPSSFSPPPLLLPLANPVELIPAAKIGDEATVASLLANGARLDLVDTDGDTPMADAKSQGHAKVVALLEAHK